MNSRETAKERKKLANNRQQLIEAIKRIMEEEVRDEVTENTLNRAEEVLDAARDYLAYVTPQFKNEDIMRLMYRLTNSVDDSADRKVLCGLTLGVVMGLCKFTVDSAKSLSNALQPMLLANDSEVFKATMAKLIMAAYIEAKATASSF